MRAKGRIGPIVFCATLLFVGALVATRVAAQAPLAATVTGVDARTGVITARVNSTGQAFDFTLANRALISRLRAGQGVYVNLGNKQVSLDGKSPAGTIRTLFPLGRNPGAPANSGNTNTNTNAPPNAPTVSPLCSQGGGGTSNPLTADMFGKSAGAATFCFNASCGASTTISGTTFPAGESDWLIFSVPAPRTNCAMPIIEARITSSGGIVFDVQVGVNGAGSSVPDSYHGSNAGPGSAVGVQGIAGLGTTLSPLPPGAYLIRIHGATATTVGTWTLKITG
jgi:hypothetical protein